jgi:hypothetical protein
LTDGQPLAASCGDQRLSIAGDDVACGCQRRGRTSDAFDVVVSRCVTFAKLVVAEARECAADEFERMERIGPERIGRRVTTERRSSLAPTNRRPDVRQANAAGEMTIGIGLRDECIGCVHATSKVSSSRRLLAVFAVCPPRQVGECGAEDRPGIGGVLVGKIEQSGRCAPIACRSLQQGFVGRRLSKPCDGSRCAPARTGKRITGLMIGA